MIDPEKLADLLAYYRQTKARLKDLREEMARAAVEIGMTQEETARADLVAFLDGFLMARGQVPAYRREKDGS